MGKKNQKANRKKHSSFSCGSYCFPQRLLAFLLAVIMALSSGGIQQLYASEATDSTEMTAEQDETEFLDEADAAGMEGMVALEVEEVEPDADEANGEEGESYAEDAADEADEIDLSVYADAAYLLAGAAAFRVEKEEDTENTEDVTGTESTVDAEDVTDIEDTTNTEDTVDIEDSMGTAGTQNGANKETADESDDEDAVPEDEPVDTEYEVIVTRSGLNSSSSIIVAQDTTYYGLTWALDSNGLLTIGVEEGASDTTIEYYADWNDYSDSVIAVVIEEGVTGIGVWAFEDYTNLVRVTIPSSVIEIDYCAFYNCTSLTSVTISEGVEQIGESAFDGCSKLQNITIPSSVKVIGDSAFNGCSSLSSIAIPSGVEEIGDYAFYNCTELSSVTIASGVKTIGKYVFRGCTALKTLTINDASIEIGEGAFYGCTKLSSVLLSGVTIIGNYAFYGCSALTSITIPSSVTSIGERAFHSCSKLASVTIKSGVASIGDYAFSDCTKLTSITIPASVTSLGSYAFAYCTSLETLTIKKGLTSISESAFQGCEKLSSVTLPSSITSIGESAFFACDALESITLPGNLKTLSAYAFYACGSLEAITIPANVSTIGEYAFAYCNDLCYLFIQDGVKKISTYAFYDCDSMFIVRIPKSMTSIGKYAFDYCESIDEVYYGGTKTNWSSISISSGNSYLTNATFTYSSTTSVVVPKNEVTELQIVSSGVKVRWTQSYGAKGYYIYRKTSSGSYKKVGTVKSGSTLYYTDTTVSKNTTYYYKVKAYSGSAKSAYSSAKSIKYLKSTVKSVSNPTAATSYNIGHQNYYGWYNWSQPQYSYLVAVDSGFMRVEYTGSNVIVEYYNSKWKLTSKKTVTCELDLFGGFYAGEDAYYLVFGQTNTSESDSKEVIRVVKYSKKWKRQSNASLYGANTCTPFSGSGLSITEYGGYLYLRTGHQMYASSDGTHHQANLTMQVKESNMTVADSYSKVMNTSVGYVSHSFNQRILADDSGNLIAADHGDAYPRAMVLFKYETKAGNSTFSGSAASINVFTFKGDTGENYTGATLGGLEYSGSSYILAGSSVRQNSKWSTNSQYNIFITVTSRSKFSDSGTTTKWITSYSEGSNVSVSNPQLVKISSNKFLLMWTENSTTLKYVFLDGKGNTTTSIYSVKAYMSDCQPIYSNGYVYWYTTGSYSDYNVSKPILYAIKTSSPYSVLASTGSLAKPTLNSASNESGGVKLSWTGSLNATGYIIYRKTGSGSYKKLKKITSNKTTTYTDKTAKSGTKYTYKILAYSKSGNTTKKSSYSSEKSVNYLAAGKISSLTNTSSGIKIKWAKVSKATGYYIYRKTSSGSYKKIATIKKGSTTSYTDTAVKSKNGTTYIYKVVPYNSSTKGSFTAKTTVRLTGTSLSSVKNSASKKITVKWSKKTKITGYQIQYSTSSSFASGNKSVTVTSASTTSKAIGSLTKGKTYYVRIRTYKTVSGTKYYSKWSSKKSVKISK